MILLILLMLITRVYPELQVKHSMYVSRKSRSYSSPVGKTYYFGDYDSEYKHGPEIQAVTGDFQGKSYDIDADTVDHRRYIPSYTYFTATEPYNEHLSAITYTTPLPPTPPPMLPLPSVTTYHDVPHEEPTTKYDIDLEKIKAEARYNARYLPAKFMSDVMYDRLKSLMHYKPYSDHKINEIEFDYNNKYHSDDDNDIRTTSRTGNDIFPYFYHGPYDYVYDSNIDKAKGRRYSPEKYHNVIPVHENVSDNIPPDFKYESPSLGWSSHTVTTEANPVAGHDAFFSYVLNDYYDKASDEDPLIFNIGEWGKDIHYDTSVYDDDNQRSRRHKDKKNFRYRPDPKYRHKDPLIIPGDVTKKYHNKDNYSFYTTPRYISKDSTVAHGESVSERGHTKNNEFDNSTKSHVLKAKDKIGYDHHKTGYKSFKDIADSLAHKFGLENHVRDTRHELKQNQDKGENRKGFHRVYHKDEYMEDKEFFDNTNSSSRGEDTGNSSIRNGGSEAILKSQAVANVGDESNAIRRVGDRESNKSISSHSGLSSSIDSDDAFDRYKELAKKTAQGNDDYDDW
ncbi:uncharacterized protein LOC128678371 [Plodia interpunctella]|uniref:uncharacterized protein LOC128678371 n=1 Tax=Plodia interpunctella TaxID=58824 RepID=UPI0023677678|nr:uncharacterized protein LOC128678371 [Plodia interpunctella]